jgi:hypothetical protein
MLHFAEITIFIISQPEADHCQDCLNDVVSLSKYFKANKQNLTKDVSINFLQNHKTFIDLNIKYNDNKTTE